MISEIQTTCYTLKGDINHRQTILTSEGRRRLSQNGLALIIAALFPGGIGSSVDAKATTTTLGLEDPPLSTGDVMRGIVADELHLHQGTKPTEEQLKAFLQRNRDSTTLDIQVDSGIVERAQALAKDKGIAVIDSKYLPCIWEVCGNKTDSPLFLSVGIIAQAKVARFRLEVRECQNLLKREGVLDQYSQWANRNNLNPFEDQELMDLIMRNMDRIDRQKVYNTRLTRRKEDQQRLQKVYPHIVFNGPQSVANHLNTSVIDASILKPPLIARAIIAQIQNIPEINDYLFKKFGIPAA